MKQAGFAPIIILIGIVLAAFLVGGGYYIGTQKPGQVSKPSAVVPTKVVDETANWKR